MINISFHGATRSVTGSRHLLDINGYRILLDCGMFQGRRQEAYKLNTSFPFAAGSIDSVIISHAHMDHLGNIPNLVKQGFTGDIHSTAATFDLANIMLMDSARIQENDAVYVNKLHKKRNEPLIQPLYRVLDVPPALKLFCGHSYDHSFNISNNISVIFRDAGHILGSAITVITVKENGTEKTICFTGDLGRHNMPIIRDPYVVTNADILIIESTYGNRLHSDINQVLDHLEKVINETVARGGKLIVPSFALERTQELVYALHQLKSDHRIPDIPIFIDSPLAINATDIFKIHPECYDTETAEFLRTHPDIFGFSGLTYTSSVEDSKALNDLKTPAMIIAGSGMAEAGRILHHLKNNIEDPKNTVLIVGWQAENTLGRKIAEKLPEVPIFGEKYQLLCQVEVFDEFSAHADRKDLINWVSAGKDRWKEVFVVHGEEQAALALAESFREIGLQKVTVPASGQSFNLFSQ